MIYISHRGNINGKNLERENSLEYILEAIDSGYYVEVDIWYKKPYKLSVDYKWFLGHDEPKYEVDIMKKFKFLFHKIYFHCKNLEALEELTKYYDINCFWHQNDDVTLTSNRFIWTYPGKNLTKRSICVLPEYANYTDLEIRNCAGICSDFIEKYKTI